MGNEPSSGSSVGKPSLGTWLDKAATIIPGSKNIVDALKSWINRQGKHISQYFNDRYLTDVYVEMLKIMNQKIGGKQNVLQSMTKDIVSGLKNSRESIKDVVGRVMVNKNAIFTDTDAFKHNKIEDLIEFLLEKHVHNDKLAEAEKLLVKLQTEVKENANMLKTMKKYIQTKNMMGYFGTILELIKNSEDFAELVREASDGGFKSLQVMHDFDYGLTLIQAGMSINVDALEHYMDVGDLDTFDGIVASFHTAVCTSEAFKADGFSIGLHTEEPDDVDGFSISVGADPDGAGPAKEISVGCPLSWNSTKKGIIPVQYSIGVTDDYVLQTGLDACVILYQIKSKDISESSDDFAAKGMFSNLVKKIKSKIGDADDEETDLVQDGAAETVVEDFKHSTVENVLSGLEAIPAIPSAQLAKLSGNPSLYYSSLDWDDLSSMFSGQGARYWETLGWTESMWERQRFRPDSTETPFSELSTPEQRAAAILGFTAKTWDAPTCMEAWRSKDPNAFWHHFKWHSMLKYERKQWKTLGWKQESWDGEKEKPKSYKTKWDDLTDDEQVAAIKLGFDEERWYKSSTYFKNDRWFAFKSKIIFTDTNSGRFLRRSNWEFSYAVVRLYDLGSGTDRQLDTKTFRDMREYKKFVLEYCEPNSNTAALMKSQLRPESRKGVIYWEDLFQSYSPGLESFKDVPEGLSLDGYTESKFPNDSPRF
jgi:hypothetical protein